MNLNELIKKIDIKPKEKNEALDTYIENSDKKREKLEMLLSEFQRVTSYESAPTFVGQSPREDVEGYYNYLDKNINKLDFSIAEVIQLTGNEQLYRSIESDENTNSKFGLFLSALINKNIKEGDKVQIITSIPINNLFYRLENAEAYVDIAGGGLGRGAKNSKVYAEEAGNLAGDYMRDCELYVKKAGNFLGSGANNSKIYAEEAGDGAGHNMQNCELHVKKVGIFLGHGAKNSRIYAEEAGNLAGNYMRDCELYVKKAGNLVGSGANNSKIYADEVGSFAYNCFKRNNKVYLGEESYKEFIQNSPKYIGKVKLWEKQK